MAQDILPGLDVADVYAGALYALASDAGVVDVVRAELEELAGLFERDPQFAGFMTAFTVDDDDRERSLERILRGKVHDLVVNALQVMNHNDRAGLLPAVSRAFVLRIEAARNEVEVTARSAVALDEAQRGEVRRMAERLAGKTPLVEYVVDPEVIGGLVLEIGDHRYDYSVRRHLLSARHKLLERTNRGEAANAE